MKELQTIKDIKLSLLKLGYRTNLQNYTIDFEHNTIEYCETFFERITGVNCAYCFTNKDPDKINLQLIEWQYLNKNKRVETLIKKLNFVTAKALKAGKESQIKDIDKHFDNYIITLTETMKSAEMYVLNRKRG